MNDESATVSRLPAKKPRIAVWASIELSPVRHQSSRRLRDPVRTELESVIIGMVPATACRRANFLQVIHSPGHRLPVEARERLERTVRELAAVAAGPEIDPDTRRRLIELADQLSLLLEE